MKALLVLLLFSGCISVPARSQTIPHFKKVVYIVFENENYAPVIRQADFAKYAALGANFTQFLAETHPSQGNYVSMIAGSTLGVMTDRNYDLSQQHIGDQLEAHGMDWKNYAEAYPGNCFTGAESGNYARKHIPFMSFLNVSRNPERCSKIVNAESFMNDFKNGTLPEFSLYTPDLQNDGHDTSIDFAGNWLTKNFGEILSHPENMNDVLFVLTYDESDPRSKRNQIYTVILGANILKGEYNQQLNHVALLKMVQDEFGLGNLGRLDAAAPVIEGIWK